MRRLRLRTLLRCLSIGGLLAVTLAVSSTSVAQFQMQMQRGGGGGPGGNNADPEAIWAMMGGTGKDSIDVNANPMLKSMMERRGTPIPANGILVKSAWRADFDQKQAERAAGGNNGGGRGGMNGGDNNNGGKGGRGGMNGGDNNGMGGGGKGGRGGMNGDMNSMGGGGRGNFGGMPGAMPTAPGLMPGMTQPGTTEDDVARRFARLDREPDGRITPQEASRSDTLGPNFERYDTNRDGVIDLAEFRVFADDMANNRLPNADPRMMNQQQPNWGQQPSPNWGGNPQGGVLPQIEEDARPVVFRYGKLPKSLPGWFTTLDTDKDGQIGLYEWRADGRTTAEFLVMDLNSDGLLTADEYLRWKAAKDGPAASLGGNENDGTATTPKPADARGGSGDAGTRGNDTRGNGVPQGKGNRKSAGPTGDERPATKDDKPKGKGWGKN